MVAFFKNNFINKSVKILFLNLFLLPIYPDNFKPALIGLFCLFSIIYFFKEDYSLKNKKLNSLLFLNSLPFIIVFISLSYTDDLDYALVLLLRLLPLLIFPLSFFLLKSNKTIFSDKFLELGKLLFYSSVLLFFSSIFIYFFFKGFVTKNFFLNYSHRIISQLGQYSIHPIYASLYASIALIFSISLFKNKKIKFFIFLGNSILIINLLLLSRKSAIFLMSFLFLFYLFYNKKIHLKTKLTALFSLMILAISIYKYVPEISNRFKDLVSFTEKNNPKSSSNIRLNVYKASFCLIKEKPLKGYGIGSGENVLLQKQKSNIYFKDRVYNSHNQYLAYALNTGLIGVLFFIFFIFKNLKLSFLSSFEYTALLLFFISLMFIENVLDRQNGIILFSLFANYFAFFTKLKIKK